MQTGIGPGISLAARHHRLVEYPSSRFGQALRRVLHQASRQSLRVVLTALTSMALTHAAHAELPPSVAQALEQSGIPDSHIGLVVQEIDGTPLITHGEDRALNPASVMKLLTTLAALDILGPAHTFKTTAKLDGALNDDVLTDNLILQGGGDPGMTPERFWLLLRELRQRGLREIRGDVLLDNRLYNLMDQDPAGFDQAPLRPYNAPIAPLLVNFNTYRLRIESANDQTNDQQNNQTNNQANDKTHEKVQTRLDPPAPGVVIDNRLQVTDEVCNGGNGADRITTRLDNSTLIVEGRYPRTCGARTEALNLQTPQTTTADWFRTLWQELGGELRGQIREGVPSPEAIEYLSADSAPLSLLIRDINKFSNNVMAKMLFLNLGVARYGAPATVKKSDNAMRAWLSERNVPQPKLVFENGAGLSRWERITAGGLANLLAWAAKQPLYYEFAASLPAVGVDGTQKNRFNDVKTQGRAWLKSGTLNGVRGLAGYVLGPDGQRRILVLLINHAKASMATPVQQALLEWAMKYTNTHTKTVQNIPTNQ